jgi:aminopeptidase N
MMKLIISFIPLSFMVISLIGQTPSFTHQDSIRGSITSERAWWDLTYYHLEITVYPEDSLFKGQNTVYYKVLEPKQLMQIDLQPPMKITQVEQNGTELDFSRDGNAYYIFIKAPQVKNAINSLKISYEGRPKVSLRPPWDGGVSWSKDKNGNDFIATSCQGDGASLWWPCKDHMYDEPDSMLMSFTVPKDLTAVGNGTLMEIEKNKKDNTKTYHWFVSNPINNYCVNMNVGDYVHFGEAYDGEKGPLDCDYYVLSYNLKKAKDHFKQVPMMLEAFEYWFGPYPFYEDSYKLVEVPYPGMEHQSSVTYGNGYENGFIGRGDISHSGWGDKFDFIIIHESGHEWFANSITYKDIADMWIHEGFIAYSENLYVDYHYGKEVSSEYVRGTRLNIKNDRPIIGYYDVNYSGSGDMYPKGANMLHTVRQIIDNDSVWRNLLRGLNEEFYHQTVTTEQIENYVDERIDANLAPFFDQYLRDVRIPVFEYAIVDGNLRYRWANVIDGFDIPIFVYLNGEKQILNPTTLWSSIKVPESITEIEVDKDFYIIPFELTSF